MTISKTSWHYKLNNFVSDGNYTPRDLCSYFWRTVAVSILPIVVIAAIAMLITAVVLLIMAFIDDFLKALLSFGVGAGIMIVYLIVVYGIKRGVRKTGFRRLRLSESLIGQYASAKKRRICPMIELED